MSYLSIVYFVFMLSLSDSMSNAERELTTNTQIEVIHLVSENTCSLSAEKVVLIVHSCTIIFLH